MSERRQLGVQDALWLEMDRPTNLMVVDSLVWTAEPIDWKRFRAVAKERLWDRYAPFRSVAVHDPDGHWYWEERPRLSISKHIEHVVLAAPGDDETLQEFVGSHRTVPLDRELPLWKVFCIDGYKGGSAILCRTHHAIADGIRMVQLAMSLFDASPEGGAILAPAVHLHGEGRHDGARSMGEQVASGAVAVAEELVELTADAAARMSRVATDPVGVARDGWEAAAGVAAKVASAAVGATRELAGTALTNPVGAAHDAITMATAAARSAAGALQEAMAPRLPGHGPLVDLFSAAPGDVDVARKLLVGTRNDPTLWTGKVGSHKAVAWSEPLPLAEVKTVAKRHGATVNDVLVTCVAGTLHSYLEHHGARTGTANFMIPVNLKPLDLELPDELGNSFALVQLELPTDEADPLAVLDVVQRRMRRIKSGHEAAVAFKVQELISGLSRTIYQASVDLLANRSTGVMTNVPGPPIPVYVAGRKVVGMTGWAPLSGDQPLCFTIYSYDGKVFVGIACDAGLVPDHRQIVDGFAPAFHRLAVAER